MKKNQRKINGRNMRINPKFSFINFCLIQKKKHKKIVNTVSIFKLVNKHQVKNRKARM